MFGSRGLWVLALVAAAVPVGPAPAQKKPASSSRHVKKITKILSRPVAAAQDGGALHRLLLQRVDVARQAYQGAAAQYEQGVAGIKDVMREARRVIAAELAAQTTPRGRVAVLEKALAVAREHEQLVQELVDAGGGPALLLQDARYDRLTAEIELLKARADTDAPK